MHSLKELYKVGNGPSSSHTMGPLFATKEFLMRYPDCEKVSVKLYGSLALTGKGHLTDYIIQKTLFPLPCTIQMIADEIPPHPNTMVFEGYQNGRKTAQMRVFSIGGGSIQIEGEKSKKSRLVYPHRHFKQIKEYCMTNELSLPQYVDQMEGKTIDDYLETIYHVMLQAIDRGLSTTGVLPGKLQVKRKASMIYQQKSATSDDVRQKIVAYAYAVSEENASGGEIVTAPTCGASGVLPALLRYAVETKSYSHEQIKDALKVAGLIGNIVKTNASISGAEAGCQAEVGTACSMAAAFLAFLQGGSFDQIERASEIALEHHLGLTCDPIQGYVQIPCIERNAVAALRAMDAAWLSFYLNHQEAKISFDLVVETMLDTGKDLSDRYKETSQGGLAKKYR